VAFGYSPAVIVRTCAEPGCDTLVVGGLCLEHEVPQTRVFVRGRPFVRPELTPSLGIRSVTGTTSTFPVGETPGAGLTKAGARLPSSS
jgi:hypothetical protein